MGSEKVEQVVACSGELGELGRRKGAIYPATEAHDIGLIEGRPQVHL